MRVILVAAAALTVAACGGGESTETNDANATAVDNMMLDPNAMGMDANGSMGATTGMDGNTAMDSNTQNMMMQDANTNSPDTNLANGL